MVVSVMKRSLSFLSLSGEFALPGRAHAVAAVHRMEQQRMCDAAYPVALRVGRDVFHRRLAVDPAEEQSRQQMRSAFFDVGARLPGDIREIALGQRVETVEVVRLPPGPPDALQQQMVQAEREI